MNREQFRTLNKRGNLSIPRTKENNSLPSDTDPTQNCPIAKVYNAMVTGKPIDIKEHKVAFNNLHADQFTSIERRNNDAFDVYAEMRRTKGNVDARVAKIDARQKQLLKQQQKNNE